jgi:hypothetical protein
MFVFFNWKAPVEYSTSQIQIKESMLNIDWTESLNLNLIPLMKLVLGNFILHYTFCQPFIQINIFSHVKTVTVTVTIYA